MARLRGGNTTEATLPSSAAHLPDPARPGPYRPFTNDPGADEAWWWLIFPVLNALLIVAIYQFDAPFYEKYIIPEAVGYLELVQFIMIIAALVVAVRLLFDPFVRQRPFVLTVTIIGALSCFYIAGEEISWGQQIVHWNTPEYWAELNRQNETNLHNTYNIFDKLPRAVLELGVVIGGILVPLAAVFNPRVRANKLSLFLPPLALVPASLLVLVFKYADIAHSHGYGELVGRPSETIEFYLYFFILAYLLIYTRRIRAIEAEEGVLH